MLVVNTVTRMQGMTLRTRGDRVLVRWALRDRKRPVAPSWEAAADLQPIRRLSKGLSFQPRCMWCHRRGRVCWTMPCLTLRRALDMSDDEALQHWEDACGVI